MNGRSIFSGALLFLAGCAGGGDGRYPSLAKRPAESYDYVAEAKARAEAEAAAAAYQPDPVFEAEIARLSQQVESGAAQFDRAFADVQRRVREGSGATIGSDAWLDAQGAISALEGMRYEAVTGLAGLDQLYIDRLAAIHARTASGGVDLIAVARAKALEVVDSQNDRLDRLKAMLKAA